MFSGEESKEERLRRHFPAAFGAVAASLDAIVHVADPLTFGGAIFADIGAFGAEMLMVRRAYDHDLGAGAADLGTGEHQLNVLRGGVRSAELEAVIGARAEAGLVAAQTFVDAGLHGRVEMVHDRSPVRRATTVARG
jgi:hypothetical protein